MVDSSESRCVRNQIRMCPLMSIHNVLAVLFLVYPPALRVPTACIAHFTSTSVEKRISDGGRKWPRNQPLSARIQESVSALPVIKVSTGIRTLSSHERGGLLPVLLEPCIYDTPRQQILELVYTPIAVLSFDTTRRIHTHGYLRARRQASPRPRQCIPTKTRTHSPSGLWRHDSPATEGAGQ